MLEKLDIKLLLSNKSTINVNTNKSTMNDIK